MSNQEAGIGIEATKKTSVTSLASTASSWSDSPYIRLMTDSARKRSESSQTSVEIEKRSRKVSENPSQSDLIEMIEPEMMRMMMISMLMTMIMKGMMRRMVTLALMMMMAMPVTMMLTMMTMIMTKMLITIER